MFSGFHTEYCMITEGSITDCICPLRATNQSSIEASLALLLTSDVSRYNCRPPLSSIIMYFLSAAKRPHLGLKLFYWRTSGEHDFYSVDILIYCSYLYLQFTSSHRAAHDQSEEIRLYKLGSASREENLREGDGRKWVHFYKLNLINYIWTSCDKFSKQSMTNWIGLT